MTKAQNNGHIVFEADDADQFVAPEKTVFASAKQKHQIFTDLKAPFESIKRLMALKSSPDKVEALLAQYAESKEMMNFNNTSEYVSELDTYIIPFGLYYSKYRGGHKDLRFLTLTWSLPSLLAFLCKGNAEHERMFINKRSDLYAAVEDQRQNARDQLASITETTTLSDLAYVSAIEPELDPDYPHFASSSYYFKWDKSEAKDPQDMHSVVESMFAASEIKDDRSNVYLAADAKDIDLALGAVMPDDYCPIVINRPNVHDIENGSPITINHYCKEHGAQKHSHGKLKLFNTLAAARSYLSAWTGRLHTDDGVWHYRALPPGDQHIAGDDDSVIETWVIQGQFKKKEKR